MQDVMAVVVPLSVEIAGQMARGVVVILQNEVNFSLRLDRATHFRGHLVEPIRVAYGVHGIETKTIEEILDQPIQGVIYKIVADLPAAKVDCRTPGRIDIVPEHFRCVSMEVIPVGAEMIVDDV